MLYILSVFKSIFVCSLACIVVFPLLAQVAHALDNSKNTAFHYGEEIY